MNKWLYRVLIAVLVLLFSSPALAADVYVATTGNDTTGDGTIGNPYRTPQKGVDGLASQGPGNTLYFRSGEYTTIPIWQGESNKRGIDTSGLTGATSWENSYTIRSYPGEWAVFNLAGLTESYISCFRGDDQPGQQGYIEYSHMEIKNGYGIDGCGGIIIRGGPYKLRFLHIHDNTAANGGGNPAGIILSGATGGSVVEYNYLSGNGCAGRLAYNENGANLAIFSDYLYTDSCDVDTFGSQALTNANGYATARWGNIVRYNYMDGGNATIKTGVGLKNKAIQFLATDTRGLAEPVDVNSWYDKGDDYHHNILVNHEYDAMYIKNDFGQVRNNIIDQSNASSSEESRRGIETGLSGKNFRGPWKPVTYNNTIVGTHGFALGYHGAPQCSGRDALYSIYYTYNNLVSENTYYDNKALICFDRLSSSTYSSIGSPPWDINNRLFTEDNYYYDCNTSTTQILASTYTLTELNALDNTSGTVTHDNSSAIFAGTSGADQYKLSPSYSDYSTVSTDGRGGSHPYLAGVSIPSYRGAVNPDDDAWVDGVMADLADTTYLRSQEDDPAWVEGATPTPTYYVDKNHPSASNANPGTEALPFITIQRAADVMAAGETVLIKTGIYNEYVKPANSGTSSDPITFKAYPGDSPVIDGTGVAVPGYDGLLHIEDRNYIVIDGLEIRDTAEYLVKVKNSTYITIRDCTIHNNAGVYRSGVHFVYGSNNTIEDSEIYNSGRNAINCESSSYNNFRYNYIHSNPDHNGINIFPKTDELPQQLYSHNNIIGNKITGCTHGIYLRYQTDQLIANNIIYDNSAPGINFQTHLDDAYDHDADTLVVNNTIVGNGGDAIENLNARNLTIKNNIISGNGAYLLDFDSSVLTGHDIGFNVFYGAGFLIDWGGTSYSTLSAWQSGTTHGTNSAWADPDFVDSSNSDYSINPASPAVNNGTNLSASGVIDDIDGVTRPQGAAYDIGAYESAAPGTFTHTPITQNITVPYDTTVYSVTGTTANATSVVSDPDVTNTGTVANYSFPVPLSVGANLITITASDGTTDIVHTVTITRQDESAPPTPAGLFKGGRFSGGIRK